MRERTRSRHPHSRHLRHLHRTFRKSDFWNRFKSGADWLSLMIGFAVMMTGCMLTVRSVYGGLLVFIIGFLLFWL